jgi:hypothetical protein
MGTNKYADWSAPVVNTTNGSGTITWVEGPQFNTNWTGSIFMSCSAGGTSGTYAISSVVSTTSITLGANSTCSTGVAQISFNPADPDKGQLGLIQQFSGATAITASSINYTTGDIWIQFSSAPSTGQTVSATYVGGPGMQGFTSNVTVESNVFKNNVRADSSLFSAYNVKFIRNTFYNALGFSSIHCEPSDLNQVIINVTFAGNVVDDGMNTNAISCTAQSGSLLTKAVAFRGNYLYGGSLLSQRVIGADIEGNYVFNNNDPGGSIQVFGRDARIVNNHVYPEFTTIGNSGSRAGIIHDCTNVNNLAGKPAGTGNTIISNNEINSAYIFGIQVNNCSNEVIASNVIKNTQQLLNTAIGISLENTVSNATNRNVLANNRAFDDQSTKTQQYGFRVDSGVTNTTFVDNDGNGNLTGVLNDLGTSTYKLGNPGVVNATLSDSFLSPALTTPTIGGETMSTVPRAEWTGSFGSSNSPGWRTIPDKAITVTRINLQMGTAPAGCTTLQTVRVTDGTTPIAISLANGGTTDDATFAQGYAGGAALTMTLTAGAGCTTAASNVNATVQYKMQ